MQDPAIGRLQAVYCADYGRLVAAAARILQGDVHAAQDAVQDAWLRLADPRTLAGLDTDTPEKLRSLLYITVCNAARNQRRDRARHETPLAEGGWALLPDPAPGPEAAAEAADARRILAAALYRLDPTDRAILLLQYGHGCTSAQIAALLGLRRAAVRKRAQRARQRLQDWLRRAGQQTL